MELLDPTEISRAIQARHLATPMAHAFTLTPGDSAPAAAALMHSRQFNFAPVIDSSRVLGIFESTPAPQAGTVDEYMRVLTADVLVSSDMALPELVELLCEQPFVLVLQGHHIAGLITPVDLFSAPARTHFYLRLACTEMLLAQYLRRVHPDQATAIAQLPASAQNRHRKIAAQLRASDDFLDDIAALSLADLVRLAGNDESFRDRTLARGGRGWRWLSDGIAKFRDNVMHPARDVSTLRGFSIQKIADAERRLTILSEAAADLLREETPQTTDALP